MVQARPIWDWGGAGDPGVPQEFRAGVPEFRGVPGTSMSKPVKEVPGTHDLGSSGSSGDTRLGSSVEVPETHDLSLREVPGSSGGKFREVPGTHDLSLDAGRPGW